MSKAEQLLCMGCMMPLEGNTPCQYCGFAPDTAYDENYLAPGSRLGERYIVGRVAKKNGEGALYIGYDRVPGQSVWIREYAPMRIAHRDKNTGALFPQDGHGAQYKANMSDFEDICNEVMRLSVTEPVVPIEAVVRQGNTVYAVYRHMSMVSLKKYMQARGDKLPVEEAVALLYPLCNTLALLHNSGQIHRGISPRTVYISKAGKLYLWDFALSAIRTDGCELEAELFNGFSAPEQYSPSGWQGAWTDVYSMAALLYWMISGILPPKATQIGPLRVLAPLSDLVMELPQNVSAAVEAAMKPEPAARTQSVAVFASALAARDISSTAIYDTSKLTQNKQHSVRQAGSNEGTTSFRKQRGNEGSFKYIALALLCTVLILIGIGSFIMTALFPEMLSGSSSSASARTPSSSILPKEDTSEGSVSEGSESEPEEDKRVPLFTGQTWDAVQANVEYQERFIFELREEFSDTWAKGVIYQQQPAEGTLMPNRGTIILHVSKGPNLKTMPNVVGKTLLEAQDIFFDNEIIFETFDQYDATATPGTIIKTIPEAGKEFDPSKTGVYVFVVPETPVSESSRLPDSQNSNRDEQIPLFRE